MEDLILRLLGRQRITVTPDQRVIVLRNGKLTDVLDAGTYTLPVRNVELEWHDADEMLRSRFETALIDGRSDLAERHLHVVRTGADEVAVIEHDGRVFTTLAPDSRAGFWLDAGRWSHTLHDATADAPIEAGLFRRLQRHAALAHVVPFTVAAGHVGLVFVNGALAAELAPGTHAFWRAGRTVEAKVIDLRRRSLDVTGQEILTRDRVSVRVNLAAEYRVTDARRAVTEAHDFTEVMHRELQFAFRRTLGALTLDELLARKVDVSEDAATAVREQMAALGVAVDEIALKDVILPGDIRDILNGVVAAEKEAEANVVRRREETNATRSLLNTAKVMAENPVMLRLKELEALETISGRVGHLSVHNGSEGLLNDLVRLRD